MNLEEEVENIRLARLYTVHGNYKQATDIYFGILEALSTDHEVYPYVLVEYAICMTESFFTKCEKDYLKLLNAKKSKMEINDEDLECAWDCFETARLYFEKLGRADYLAKIHKYSADILSFNNDFATAVIEYEKALDYCGSDFAKCAILEDMADCYGNMKNKKKVQEIEKTIEDIQLILEK